MFDISSLESIRSNPLLARSFIKHLSAYELADAIKNGLKNGDVILNDENIIEGILESDDEGKLLLLASGSKLDGFAQNGLFTKLYSRSEGMKSSLVSNSQLDWYGVFFWNEGIRDSILEDILAEDSRLKIPFYKNPRMDRRLIASIIRAKNYDLSKHTYDFTRISFAERYTAAANSLEIQEIESEDYPGKDCPDSNELHFHAPLDSVVVLVRDLFNAENIEEAGTDYYIVNLIYYIDGVKIGIDYSDWFSKDELHSYEYKIPYSQKREDALKSDALKRVIQFFDENTSKFSLDDDVEVDKDLFLHYAKACLVIVMLSKLLSNSQYCNKIDAYLPALIKSENWVIRASGYSFIFQNLNVLRDEEVLPKLIKTFAEDKLALFWGINCSSHMVSVRRVSHAARQNLDRLFEELNLSENLVKYFDALSDRIFSYRFRNVAFDILEKELDTKLTNKSVKSVDKYLTLQAGSSEGKAYQVGKTKWKFFK